MRSRPERQLWHDMTTEQRRDVLRLIVGRKQPAYRADETA
nr:DUF1289 domain-containing protein [Psychrobacter coccoides]